MLHDDVDWKDVNQMVPVKLSDVCSLMQKIGRSKRAALERGFTVVFCWCKCIGGIPLGNRSCLQVMVNPKPSLHACFDSTSPLKQLSQVT